MKDSALNVLLVCTSLKGGAGGSAYKLLNGLRGMGIDSKILVKYKSEDDDDVIRVTDPRPVRWLRRVTRMGQDLEMLPLKFYRHRDRSQFFSAQWIPDRLASMVSELAPDVINLRWIGNLLRIETLARFDKPLVWTLSDMWPFTGGCYMPENCTRYTQSCGNCPILGSHKSGDLSYRVWSRKANIWRNLNLTVVTPSTWLAECARSSSLFRDTRIEVIPTGIDTEAYKPVDKMAARRILGLSENKHIVLFGAWGIKQNKGFHFLTSALEQLARQATRNAIELVTFGFSRPDDMPEVGVQARFLGRLLDTVSKVLAYSAADVFVAPSMMENFPNTVLEASACGVPSVAFRIGGMPDIIEHEKSGYLATPFDVADLARGIEWVLADTERQASLGRFARGRVEQEFSLERYAQSYLNLFEQLAGTRSAESRSGVL